MDLGIVTGQLPNNVSEMSLARYTIMRGGGFTTGALNFGAKVRWPSIDAEDMFHGHVGALDLCARAVLAAERMIEHGGHAQFVARRYQGWRGATGTRLLAGDLEGAAAHARQRKVDEPPASRRPEWLENRVNRFDG